ncbi:tyrosine-type recombinase/integrase [Deinococcus sp. SL84]|uniref:tyrosine-type recombinase/integrase n=1 Tax=Deinococcus sp. SL84 TaxID=2994663 RepID=UPI002272FF3D|nr:site-specific integrase [Deinococcus sp. SL84]MCY1702763.1 site-specific integrase [Deinococcus sp. SL84]
MTGRTQTKRGNGSGSVRKLPSGKWQWRASIRLHSGETLRVAGTAPTKTAAEAALREAQTDASRGQFTVTQKTTVAEFLLNWHALRADTLAAKYNQSQTSLIKKHIIPGIGKRTISSLTPRDLEVFYASLVHQDERRPDTFGQPLGDSMKRQVHNLLHLAFNDAVRHGELLRNPADTARPRYTRKAAQEDDLKAWTPDEARRFYEVARGDRRGVAFCFMLSTGMRMGEVLGLRWENVDLEGGTIHIKEALVSLNGHLHRTTPKTARSKRTLEVSGDALKILRERREQLPLEKEAAGERYIGSDAVFTSEVGTPIRPDNTYSLMKRLCQAAGVPYKGTHVLRHSFISIQGQQGLPVEVISAHVGHARASFTQDHYRSVFAHERKGLTLDFSAQPKEKDTEADS